MPSFSVAPYDPSVANTAVALMRARHLQISATAHNAPPHNHKPHDRDTPHDDVHDVATWYPRCGIRFGRKSGL
eukprot:5109029-Prymnesium_polylepis.1